MSASARRLFAALVLLAVPLLLQAQDPCASAPTAPKPDYKLTMETGSIVPEASTTGFGYTLKNDTNLLIRLENINPYAFKCSASTSTTDFKETAIASFLATLGGVSNVGSSAPTVTMATPPKTEGLRVADFQMELPDGTEKTATDDCVKKYVLGSTHQKVQQLWNNQDPINQALAEAKKAQDGALGPFNDAVQALAAPPSDSTKAMCSATVDKAKNLMKAPTFDIKTPDRFKSGSSWTPPLDQVINDMAAQAQVLIPRLTDDIVDACRSLTRQYVDEDSRFLSTFVVGARGVASTVDTWRGQIKDMTTVRASMVAAQKNVADVLYKWQNFFVDTSIHGNQQLVTYTATCTPIVTKTIPAPDSTSSPATKMAPDAAPTAGDGKAAPASITWKHDFKFGPGPRFVLAGGLVVSPLRQITFNTTATPGGSGLTANTIIQQQNSSTRILPIAMLHGRFWDQLPAADFKGLRWLPNYFSVGVTAKSSGTQGTNIEYLFGPSWAFADRQLFLTAGAYAGQQQRLANSLMVGGTTALSGANLPITQTTIWKAGFAITWAPAGK